jgi:hypothetical protein
VEVDVEIQRAAEVLNQRDCARSKNQLREKVSRHMRMLQRKPARVKKYFQHEKIR